MTPTHHPDASAPTPHPAGQTTRRRSPIASGVLLVGAAVALVASAAGCVNGDATSLATSRPPTSGGIETSTTMPDGPADSFRRADEALARFSRDPASRSVLCPAGSVPTGDPFTQIMFASDRVPTVLTVAACLPAVGAPAFVARAFRETADGGAVGQAGAEYRVAFPGVVGPIQVAMDPGQGYTVLQHTSPDATETNAVLHVTPAGVQPG